MRSGTMRLSGLPCRRLYPRATRVADAEGDVSRSTGVAAGGVGLACPAWHSQDGLSFGYEAVSAAGLDRSVEKSAARKRDMSAMLVDIHPP